MLDEVIEKRARLRALFDTLPAITLHGVVGADGAGGGRVAPEVDWSLHLKLVAWRIPGEAVRRIPLTVSASVSDVELRALKDAIAPASVIAFQGKLCLDSPFGDARASLVNLLERPSDPELESIVCRLREPVEVVDPVVGRLVLDRATDWFAGKVAWLGQQIDIAVGADEDGTPARALQTAKALLAAMAQWARRVDEHAVAALLDLKNDAWLDDDEDPVTREAFAGRMRLNSITAHPDGSFEFWFDDGDLFSGHEIRVCGSLAEGPTRADIAG